MPMKHTELKAMIKANYYTGLDKQAPIPYLSKYGDMPSRDWVSEGQEFALNHKKDDTDPTKKMEGL